MRSRSVTLLAVPDAARTVNREAVPYWQCQTLRERNIALFKTNWLNKG
ncbi:MAG: hypothetical protein F6J90_11195 [Moorea sp. SIOASIH]|nr:hypothetical protein [Moorena sp. SIOASIH]NEO36842.1 hypothetical protein [Moorena sp. SIOASIH]